MWIEVLEEKEARDNQPKPLKNVVKEEIYEVRVVIWETSDTPLVDNGATDVMIKASKISSGIE